MADLASDHAKLRSEGIVRAFAQIRMQRFEQNLLVCFDGMKQREQAPATVVQIECLARLEKRPLARD
jgi:hypothetical protein